MAGLTEQGLTILRYPEILENIKTSSEQKNIITGSDSPSGIYSEIISKELSKVWELAETVNRNFDPTSAEALNLDDLGDLKGIRRITKQRSKGVLRAVANDGVLISDGAVFESSLNRKRFVASGNTSISATLCYSANFSVAQVLDTTAYSLSVNGSLYSFTSDADATANEIVTGIKADIDADSAATWTATLVGDTLTITSDSSAEIQITTNTYLKAESVTKDFIVVAQEYGPLVVLPNTVTILISSISGVTSVTNPSAFVLGRLDETDEEFRERFESSGSTEGKGTVAALQSVIGDLSGVSLVRVAENYNDVTDADGVPKNSFEVIVQGGDNQEIADAIWDTKGDGIRPYGAINVIVIDSTGEQRSIFFTRPTAVNIAYRITYTLYDEEQFLDNGQDLIVQQALAYTNALQAGKDLIPKRVTGPIYSNVAGVDDLVIEVQTLAAAGDTPDGGSWQTTSIPISIRQFAQTNLSDIYLVEA